jgi:hypothetical protein
MRRFFRDNGLALFFLAIFLASVAGQAIAGHNLYNEQEAEHAKLLHQQPELISLGRYLTSSSFAQAITENWQSEYLQFMLFIIATIWLVQRGSTESKLPGREGLEPDKDQKLGPHAGEDAPRWARVGGVRTWIYSQSLLIVMGVIFFASWFAQSVSGWSVFNQDAMNHKEQAITWVQYLGSSDFWQDTLQNWQSEFLAVGSVAIFTVFLRSRGSAQSKPVGESHDKTAVEG